MNPLIGAFISHLSLFFTEIELSPDRGEISPQLSHLGRLKDLTFLDAAMKLIRLFIIKVIDKHALSPQH